MTSCREYLEILQIHTIWQAGHKSKRKSETTFQYNYTPTLVGNTTLETTFGHLEMVFSPYLILKFTNLKSAQNL